MTACCILLMPAATVNASNIRPSRWSPYAELRRKQKVFIILLQQKSVNLHLLVLYRYPFKRYRFFLSNRHKFYSGIFDFAKLFFVKFVVGNDEIGIRQGSYLKKLAFAVFGAVRNQYFFGVGVQKI